MGRQIVQQPNGKFAVWSSIVGDFVMCDCTVDELISEDTLDYRHASAEAETKIRSICAKLVAGEKPYFQFTHTFAEFVEMSRQRHGETDDLRSVIELANIPADGDDYAEDDAQLDKIIDGLVATRRSAIVGEVVGDWWVMAGWVGSADTHHERQTVEPFKTRADAIAHLNLMRSGRKQRPIEEGEDFFIVPGSGPISPRKYWVELEPSAEDEAAMIREALGLSRWAMAPQVLARIAELREAITPFAADVPANFGSNPDLTAISDANAEFRLNGLFNQRLVVRFPMAALVRLIRVAKGLS